MSYSCLNEQFHQRNINRHIRLSDEENSVFSTSFYNFDNFKDLSQLHLSLQKRYQYIFIRLGTNHRAAKIYCVFEATDLPVLDERFYSKLNKNCSFNG